MKTQFVSMANIARKYTLAAKVELRDQFAMAALTGLLANEDDFPDVTPEGWVRDAYRHADLMLMEREAGHDEVE